MTSEQENRLPSDHKLRKRYKIIKQISSDIGLGITYYAEDLDLPDLRQCIVKQLNRRKFGEFSPTMLEKATELFEKASKSLYQLGYHDRIPCLYARFEENEEFYLVQEYIEGNDLWNEIIPNQPWTEEQTINFLREILEVLVFAHQKKFIHQNIKPSNIIRKKYEQKLVLINFGVAKEINTLINGVYANAGISHYEPLEQGGIDPKPVLASDVYAVGVIGILGLTGSTYITEWRKNAKVSDNLATILDKMTHTHWQERYQNANEALDAINQMFIIPSINSTNINNKSIEYSTNSTFTQKFANWWNTGDFK